MSVVYKKILRPLFFRGDPERVHNSMTGLGETLGKTGLGRGLTKSFFGYSHPSLEGEVMGIKFKNPIGLSAGFDKDIRLTRVIPQVGFGFMEVGAITRYPSPGNKGKRLWRLPEDEAIVVNYGLNNMGAEAALDKIKKLKFEIPVGINIAKTNRDDITGEKSVEDYVISWRLLHAHFAYTTINISCPNTADGTAFQKPQMLSELLTALSKEKKEKPALLKLSNHLTVNDVDAILETAAGFDFIDGFIVTNLSRDRSSLNLKTPRSDLGKMQGGISGRPIKNKSTEFIRHIYRKAGTKYTIIGVGGVFTANDAYEKIKAGASLIQLITGLIYEGPGVVKQIKTGLVELLKKDGFGNISEAVGKSVK